MNYYYFEKTGKHITDQRIAEADRARLVRSLDAEDARRRAGRPQRRSRGAVSLGALLQRVALF